MFLELLLKTHALCIIEKSCELHATYFNKGYYGENNENLHQKEMKNIVEILSDEIWNIDKITMI